MKLTFKEFKKLIDVLRQPCCYSGMQRKTLVTRIWDNLCWYTIVGRVNCDYCLYGLDLVNSEPNTFLSLRTRVNDITKIRAVSKYDDLLKFIEDKYCFYCFCKKYHLSHPQVFEHYKNGVRDLLEEVDVQELLSKDGLFCKQTLGFGGHEVKCIKSMEMLEEVKKQWQDKEYILQRGVKNHEILAKLYSGSINTIRCVTFSDGDRISVFAAVLRIGTSLSGPVDNLSSGGIGVGIKDDGTLMAYGHYESPFKEKVLLHPDTKINFAGFQVPFFKEAIELALEAHSCIKEIPTIGWDIAITPVEPVLIEANYDWGLMLMQSCHGGLKKEWENFIKQWYKKNRS